MVCRTVLIIGPRPKRGGVEVVVFGKQGVAALRGGDAADSGADDVPLIPGKAHRVAEDGRGFRAACKRLGFHIQGGADGKFIGGRRCIGAQNAGIFLPSLTSIRVIGDYCIVISMR